MDNELQSYEVQFSLNGSIIVEAENEQAAEDEVKEMDDTELSCFCDLQIDRVREV